MFDEYLDEDRDGTRGGDVPSQLYKLLELLGRASGIRLGGICAYRQNQLDECCNIQLTSQNKKFQTQVYDKGDFYYGQIKDGRRNGMGYYLYSNGAIEYSHWINNQAAGGPYVYIDIESGNSIIVQLGNRLNNGNEDGTINIQFRDGEREEYYENGVSLGHRNQASDDLKRNSSGGSSLAGCIGVAVVILIFYAVISSMINSCNGPRQKYQTTSVQAQSTSIYHCTASSSLNVRATPQSNGKIIGKLSNGEEVGVYRITNGFAEIKFSKATSGKAYVSQKFVKAGKAPIKTAASKPKSTATQATPVKPTTPTEPSKSVKTATTTTTAKPTNVVSKPATTSSSAKTTTAAKATKATGAFNKSAYRSMGSPANLVIPNGYTSIDYIALYDSPNLRSVTIPTTVTSIGKSAFGKCPNLTSVTIPTSVTSIGEWAFRDCTSLRSIAIPNSVKSIGDYAFYGCSNLAPVAVPKTTTMGKSVFFGCLTTATTKSTSTVTRTTATSSKSNTKNQGSYQVGDYITKDNVSGYILSIDGKKAVVITKADGTLYNHNDKISTPSGQRLAKAEEIKILYTNTKLSSIVAKIASDGNHNYIDRSSKQISYESYNKNFIKGSYYDAKSSKHVKGVVPIKNKTFKIVIVKEVKL